jgi:hypothetical protein
MVSANYMLLIEPFLPTTIPILFTALIEEMPGYHVKTVCQYASETLENIIELLVL